MIFKKILITVFDISLNAGGLRTGVLRQAFILNELGYKVTILTSTYRLNEIDFEYLKTLNYIRIVFLSKYIKLLNNIFIYDIKSIKNEISKNDIVFTTATFNFLTNIVAFYSIKFKIPYFVRPIGILNQDLINIKKSFIKKLYILLFDSYTIKNSKCIIYSTVREKELAEKIIGKKYESRIISETINEIIESDIILKKSIKINSNIKRILYLGRIHPKKGIEIILEAFLKEPLNGANLILNIVGSGENTYVNKLRKFINENNIREKVIFHGQVSEEEKFNFYKTSNIFILPSLSENFGLTVLEAMQCSVPVIISKGVALSEMVRQFNAGLIINQDSQELASAILNIITNVDLKDKLTKNAHILIKREFSQLKAMDQYKELIYRFDNINSTAITIRRNISDQY